VFLRFPGQWQDETWENASLSTKLYYNVYRWYEHGTGRYASSEILGYPSEIGRYAYATSNPVNTLDRLGLLSEPPDNLIPFPGNPNPYPTKPPWQCDDVRPFDPTRVPRRPVFDPQRILTISGRAAGAAALSIVNVKVWTCGISRIYCMTQGSGLTPCECMGSMDPGGKQCSGIPSSPSLRCPPTPKPVEPPSCCQAPSQ